MLPTHHPLTPSSIDLTKLRAVWIKSETGDGDRKENFHSRDCGGGTTSIGEGRPVVCLVCESSAKEMRAPGMASGPARNAIPPGPSLESSNSEWVESPQS